MSRPMFQKRHYKAIAAVICSQDYNVDLAEYYALESISIQLSKIFLLDNDNFNRKKFMAACGF